MENIQSIFRALFSANDLLAIALLDIKCIPLLGIFFLFFYYLEKKLSNPSPQPGENSTTVNVLPQKPCPKRSVGQYCDRLPKKKQGKKKRKKHKKGKYRKLKEKKGENQKYLLSVYFVQTP